MKFSTTIYLLFITILLLGFDTNVESSSNGINVWEDVTPEGASSVSSLIMDPFDSSILYVGTNKGIYKSTNSGDSWFETNIGLTTQSILHLAIDPKSSHILYATTDIGLFKSIDNGNHWVIILDNIPDSARKELRINPQNPNILYRFVTGAISKSQDGGITWKSLGYISSYLNDFEINPLSPNILYVSSNEGVFKSTNDGDSWALINEGLTNTIIQDIDIDIHNPEIIYAHRGDIDHTYKSVNSGQS